MKIITFFTALIFTVSISFAQELTVKYEISMESSEPEVQAQIGMMQGSTYTMYLKGNQSRIESNMGGGLMVNTTIIDVDKKKGVMLMDGMMGKLAATYNLDSLNNLTEESKVDIELVDETKEILGYKCKKAIVYGENDLEIVYWYTEEFKPSDEVLGSMIKKGVPGLPLEFSIEQPQITMIYTAIDLQKKVKNPNEKFNLSIPEGYSEKSFDDIKSMLGQ